MFRGLRDKLVRGLTKTRDAIADGMARLIRPGRRVDAELIAELEELLIGADLGVSLTTELCTRLQRNAAGLELETVDALRSLVARELELLLPAPSAEPVAASAPRVTLVVGVNGSGKTTTVGKLAARWSESGRSVLVAAADTFRAAAIEQLAIWCERARVPLIRAQHGADPAAVAFDAARASRARGVEELLIDTAGRLHNKKPLMDELEKVGRVVSREISGAPHQTLLVLDGTTGANAIAQAREFSRIVPVNGLVLTKLDGTARGGVAIAIGRELGLPVRYVGVGEGIEDLLEFDAAEYLAGLLRPAATRSR